MEMKTRPITERIKYEPTVFIAAIVIILSFLGVFTILGFVTAPSGIGSRWSILRMIIVGIVMVELIRAFFTRSLVRRIAIVGTVAGGGLILFVGMVVSTGCYDAGGSCSTSVKIRPLELFAGLLISTISLTVDLGERQLLKKGLV